MAQAARHRDHAEFAADLGLIFKGEVHELKRDHATSLARWGMQTFDQALFDLYEAGKISYEDRNAKRRLHERVCSPGNKPAHDQRSEGQKDMLEGTRSSEHRSV
jgi:hypothetical protein